MLEQIGIPNGAFVEALITIIAFVGWAAREYVFSRTPKLEPLKEWVGDKLAHDELMDAYKWAQENASTNEDRRKAAARYLQDLVKRKWGMFLPDAVANLIVEYTVNAVKLGYSWAKARL